MYGLPSNVNLDFFNDRILLQACFGAHDLILNLEGDIRITVMSSLGCLGPGGEIHRYVDFQQAASAVLALLNHRVVSAQGDEAGTLTLRFDGGGVLVIYDDSKAYESYTIANGDQMIIV